MEDVAVTIFRVIFIAILILGAVKRRQPKGRKSASDNRPADTSRGPVAPESQQPVVMQRPAQTQPSPSRQQSPGRPQQATKPRQIIRQQPVIVRQPEPLPAAVEVDPDEAEAMAAEYYKNRTRYTPAAPSESVAPAPEDRAGRADEGEETWISGRFNLRDAVLYSEILKPKFDE